MRHRGDIRALKPIADHTRLCQVFGNGLAAVLPANDVVDFMTKRRIIFMKQAVLTPEHCPMDYIGPQFCRDIQERVARIS